MVTRGYHLLIPSIKLQVRADRINRERSAQVKKAGIVVGAVLAVAVLGLSLR
jgi:hypothetical protein